MWGLLVPQKRHELWVRAPFFLGRKEALAERWGAGVNVFFYDLLKKAMGLSSGFIRLGILIFVIGLWMEHSETAWDQISNALTGNPSGSDVWGSGIFFVLLGLIWKPVSNSILSSLEKSFAEADRTKLGLSPATSPNAPAPVGPPLTNSWMPLVKKAVTACEPACSWAMETTRVALKGAASMTEAPGTTPTSPSPTQAPTLWNPNAAINWSVLFSPIFGGLIHAKNWETLGDLDKAKKSRLWAWGGIAVLVVALFMHDAGSVPGLIYLIAWYFMAGRKQAARVKELFGTSYVRKPWGKVLGIAAVILVGVVIVLGIAGALSGDGGEYEE